VLPEGRAARTTTSPPSPQVDRTTGVPRGMPLALASDDAEAILLVAALEAHQSAPGFPRLTKLLAEKGSPRLRALWSSLARWQSGSPVRTPREGPRRVSRRPARDRHRFSNQAPWGRRALRGRCSEGSGERSAEPGGGCPVPGRAREAPQGVAKPSHDWPDLPCGHVGRAGGGPGSVSGRVGTADLRVLRHRLARAP
jgi:hypothetical protein